MFRTVYQAFNRKIYFLPIRHGTQSNLLTRLRGAVTVRPCSTDGEEDGADMNLKGVVSKLNTFAPTSLAGSWDNVGLLVQPSPPHVVTSMLLTNDLTEAVMEEALEKKVNMILSYHPPIFVPLKRLTQRTWKERIIVKCAENRIAVFSPHTSLDAVSGGVNDWLIQPFAGKIKPIEMVQANQFKTPGGSRLEITVMPELADAVQKQLLGLPGVVLMAQSKSGSSDPNPLRLCLNCTEQGLPRAVECINQFESVRDTIEILQLCKPPIPGHGQGRFVKLDTPVTLREATDRIKNHLRLSHVRLALGVEQTMDSRVKTLAVCAGSGSTVLRGVEADLWLTGEMSHHETLDANHSGTSVILCEHSNTERGYLKVLKGHLDQIFEGKIDLHLSDKDRDPLEIV